MFDVMLATRNKRRTFKERVTRALAAHQRTVIAITIARSVSKGRLWRVTTSERVGGVTSFDVPIHAEDAFSDDTANYIELVVSGTLDRESEVAKLLARAEALGVTGLLREALR